MCERIALGDSLAILERQGEGRKTVEISSRSIRR